MKSGKKVKRAISLILVLVFVLSFAPAASANVSSYNINWAVQSGANEITVELQANYCYACNPNSANDPGCTPFTHSGGLHSGCIEGTYAAVRLKDNNNNVIGLKKMVINPTNWPLTVLHKQQFVFPALSLAGVSSVKVEADLYCSWCGHYYPQIITLQVIPSDNKVTYTGALSADAGDTVGVSGILEDAAGNPLVGKTVSFTLDGLAPVSAVTDASGVAATSLAIPATMAGGVYQMVTRFNGDADYFPCSDTDDFTVSVPQGLVWNIYSSKQMDIGNDRVSGDEFANITLSSSDTAQTAVVLVDTNGDGKNDKAIVTVNNGYGGYYNSVVLDIINIGPLPINRTDLQIVSSSADLQIRCVEGAKFVVKPNRKKAIGFDFMIKPGAAPGVYTFEVSL